MPQIRDQVPHGLIAFRGIFFQRLCYQRLLAELRNSELKTARAWALKETAMALYEYIYERPARNHFRWWHGWAVRSRLQPMIEKARMLTRRFDNIITYLRHRITNR